MTLVRQERRGRVEVLTLSRPKEFNALNTQLVTELGERVDRATADPEVGVIVLAAEGRGFCAGADLREALDKTGDAQEFREWLLTWRRVFRAIEVADKPVIAAVQGVALAGGLELVLACDVVVASTQASFGDAHIRYGLVPGGGGSQRLPDAVGNRWARWLMYSGSVIDAETAVRIGLAQHILPAASFADDVVALADEMAHRSAPALAFMKRQTRAGSVTDDGLDHEIEAAVGVVTGPDAREGLSAFVDKREPKFPSVHGRG